MYEWVKSITISMIGIYLLLLINVYSAEIIHYSKFKNITPIIRCQNDVNIYKKRTFERFLT